jgi:hypothetical protein
MSFNSTLEVALSVALSKSKNILFKTWFQFNVNKDHRGNLIAIEEYVDIPISIKRIFYMTNVTQDRGGHAHIETDQVIIAINGTFKVSLFNGIKKEIFNLDNSEHKPHLYDYKLENSIDIIQKYYDTYNNIDLKIKL